MSLIVAFLELNKGIKYIVEIEGLSLTKEVAATTKVATICSQTLFQHLVVLSSDWPRSL